MDFRRKCHHLLLVSVSFIEITKKKTQMITARVGNLFGNSPLISHLNYYQFKFHKFVEKIVVNECL